MPEDSNDAVLLSRSHAGAREVSRPWLSIPLDDYEGHMNDPDVGHLPVLANLFQRVIDDGRPHSVAIAGGNGLEAIDPSVPKRIAGIDINHEYLETVQQRFGDLPGLELHRCDLTMQAAELAPAALVHAALLFEHTGLGTALNNVVSLIEAGGRLSVILQLPGTQAHDVAITKYTSLQSVKQNFALIEVAKFRLEMASRGFEIVDEDERLLPGGKAFWLGVFARAPGS